MPFKAFPNNREMFSEEYNNHVMQFQKQKMNSHNTQWLHLKKSGFTHASKLAHFDNLLCLGSLSLAICLGLLLFTLNTGQIPFTSLKGLSIAF